MLSEREKYFHTPLICVITRTLSTPSGLQLSKLQTLKWIKNSRWASVSEILNPVSLAAATGVCSVSRSHVSGSAMETKSSAQPAGATECIVILLII